MDWLRKISEFFLRQLAYQYAIQRARRKMTLMYLKAVQAARRSLLAAILIFFVLQLMILGFLGAGITAIWLYPTPDLESKLYLLLAFFSILFLIPAVGLGIFFSERVWFRLSGAKEMVEGIE